MTQPDSPEDILESLSVSISNNHLNKTGVGYAKRRMLDDKWTDEAAQAIREYYTNKFLKIVGEDEPTRGDTNRAEAELMKGNMYRNKLRAELRAAIKDWGSK